MKEGKPSQTASLVAIARALADRGYTTVPSFQDPVSARLLPRRWAAILALALRAWRRADPKVLRPAIAQLDVIPLRVARIDMELERAIGAGCRQVVLLGAGLDARAFRLSSLADVDVYEVDHPATQAYKRRKTSSMCPVARSLTFVPIDFERDSLQRALGIPPSPAPPAALGGPPYDTTRPTAWVWEGVVMYLSDDALRATLRDVAHSSAPGSRLIVNYHSVPVGRRVPGLRAILSLWGEPQIGNRSAETMEAELRQAGFTVESDTGPSDWARELGAEVPIGETARISRIVVALVRPSEV